MTFKPTNAAFRARLSDELRVSRKMLRGGIEVGPRFVMARPQGDQMVILTNLATSGPKREQALQFVDTFMKFHMCDVFVMAFQTIAPKMLTAILVSRTGFAAAAHKIDALPDGLGEIVFYDPRHTDIDILDLLPGTRNDLSQNQLDSIRSFMEQNEIAPNTYTLVV